MGDEIQRLQAENEKLRDRVSLLERRCGSLMTDADRREQQARDEAWSCPEHGKRILYNERLAWWHWANSGYQSEQRQALITALILVQRDELRGRTEPVPVDVLNAWIDRVCAAQSKVRKRPEDWPPLGNYLAGEGGFGPPAAMKAEIAEALGLRGPAPRQGELFGDEAA
ncbi:MAG: hypothetical protein J2P30_00400 [Actinobacteria bacterium]|nr:hypothetical protein [Actinomycetota bacterium]